MKHQRLFWLISLLPVFLSVSVQAAVYKWVNEDGHTTYSATPPPAGIKAIKIGITPSPETAPAPASSSNSKADSKQAATGTAPAADGQTEQQYSKETQQKLCATAREDLAKVNQGGRMRVKQEDGSSAVMTDEDRQKRVETMQKMVQKHCK